MFHHPCFLHMTVLSVQLNLRRLLNLLPGPLQRTTLDGLARVNSQVPRTLLFPEPPQDDEHLQRFYECLAQTICQAPYSWHSNIFFLTARGAPNAVKSLLDFVIPLPKAKTERERDGRGTRQAAREMSKGQTHVPTVVMRFTQDKLFC